MNVAEALAIGTRHHQNGQLAEAERIYRGILSIEPGHPLALHQLGMVAMQARQFEAAVELIAQAVRRERTQPHFHVNLGEAYRHLKQFDQALECFRVAIKLQPDMAQAHLLLGIVLQAQGQTEQAIVALRQAVKLRPDDTRARNELGFALQSCDKFAEAEACYQRVLRNEPDSAQAHFNLGATLEAQRKYDQAIACYRRAIELNPAQVDAHNNLGNILKNQGLLDEAERHYHSALRADPNYVAARTNLGTLYLLRGDLAEAKECLLGVLQLAPETVVARRNLSTVLLRQGRLDEAEAVMSDALRSLRNDASAHLDLGHILRLQGKLNAAIDCCQEALRIDPTLADAHNNLGVIHNEKHDKDAAIACTRRAIALNPNFAAAHSNLAVALQGLGHLDEALGHHRQAVATAPGDAGFHSNLLYLLNYLPDMDDATIFAEHRAWGERHADPLTMAAPPLSNDRAPNRRLKVGYVSPHFLSHAVNFFSEPILAAHDHSQFEVYCYSDVPQEDETSRRLRGYADHWLQTLPLTDQQLAERIRRDGIDILVDLTGHIYGGKRMTVFARKPAPVQVTYIGYQNTTGMLAMDYRLTDEYSDPPGTTDAFYTEHLVRLPATFFCYLPSSDAPPVLPLPALANGVVTFGSMNNFTKVTPQVLDTWTGILERVPNSRLVIRAEMTPSLGRKLRERFQARGIAADRLELIDFLPRAGYLELINRLDVALDPFPFNGHTTTCDCLWQGVPVVTLSGNSYVSRFGGSGLATLGLHELIARTPQEYVEICANLAQDVSRLASLRANLRARMAASPLLDFATFTRNLETEYRRMWHAWCDSSASSPTPGP